jgi:hypothetical protein
VGGGRRQSGYIWPAEIACPKKPQKPALYRVRARNRPVWGGKTFGGWSDEIGLQKLDVGKGPENRPCKSRCERTGLAKTGARVGGGPRGSTGSLGGSS